MAISYLLALVLTIIVETGVAFILGYRDRKSLAVVALVNVITNPILNYLLLVIAVFRIMEISTALILFLEALVVLAEWRLMVYALDRDPWQLFVLSLVMNTASYLAGLLILK
jgi:hypothetical protein